MKTDTKHSPGPWTYSVDSMEPFPIRDSEGRGVNMAHPANGRLGAAAPELLAVARAVVEWGKTKRVMTTGERHMATDAHAAIAKAEGR